VEDLLENLNPGAWLHSFCVYKSRIHSIEVYRSET